MKHCKFLHTASLSRHTLNLLPFTSNLLPLTIHQLPITVYQLPTSSIDKVRRGKSLEVNGAMKNDRTWLGGRASVRPLGLFNQSLNQLRGRVFRLGSAPTISVVHNCAFPRRGNPANTLQAETLP